MIHRAILGGLALAGFAQPAAAMDLKARLDLEPLIVRHAKANNVPPALVHRIIIRESRYNARAVGRGGALGLMQIKHGTARALGYAGSADGLLDADTNLTYAVRYLAGAYRVADGDQNRAVGFYARGYYYDAKRRGMLGAIAKAPTAAEEPVAVVAAPQPEQPKSIFSLLFTPPQPQPVQQAVQVVAEEPEAPVAAPRSKRSAKVKAAASPVAPGASTQSEPAQSAQAVGETPPASRRNPTKKASVGDVGAAAAQARTSTQDAEAAAQDPAAATRSARSAKRTAASDGGRSAQTASARPDGPGTRP